MNKTENARNKQAKVNIYPDTLKKLEASLPEGISLTQYINQLLMERSL